MKSQFVDKFNHDEDAPGYDQDVLNEADPIRTGYDQVLTWVAQQAQWGTGQEVLDLGSGTGNLAARLRDWQRLVAVDVSREMMAIARTKLAHRREVTWVVADLLEFFAVPRGPFDVVVSTYALHHLTEAEKARLFAAIREVLAPGGRAVFGDLMFEDRHVRKRFLARCRSAGPSPPDRDTGSLSSAVEGRDFQGFEGNLELAEVVEDEFFWDLEGATRCLVDLGFTVTRKRFSQLSWGVAARLD